MQGLKEKKKYKSLKLLVGQAKKISSSFLCWCICAPCWCSDQGKQTCRETPNVRLLHSLQMLQYIYFYNCSATHQLCIWQVFRFIVSNKCFQKNEEWELLGTAKVVIGPNWSPIWWLNHEKTTCRDQTYISSTHLEVALRKKNIKKN